METEYTIINNLKSDKNISHIIEIKLNIDSNDPSKKYHRLYIDKKILTRLIFVDMSVSNDTNKRTFHQRKLQYNTTEGCFETKNGHKCEYEVISSSNTPDQVIHMIDQYVDNL